MRIALYLRRSTIELQADSLNAQRERLTAWASEQGHEIVSIFEDSASGRFVEGRNAFVEMIEIVKNGAPFDAIAVRDVSRWSRAENIDLAGYYEFICRSHGVPVIYVDEPFAADQSPYSVLMKNLKRAMAAEFSMERSRTSTMMQSRVASMGFWPMSTAPFGMKRVLVDAASGAVVRDMQRGELKMLSTHRLKLAPGDPHEIETVQRIFQLYAETDISARRVADALNRDGVRGPRAALDSVTGRLCPAERGLRGDRRLSRSRTQKTISAT